MRGNLFKASCQDRDNRIGGHRALLDADDHEGIPTQDYGRAGRCLICLRDILASRNEVEY